MKPNLNIIHDFVCVDRDMVAQGGSFSFRTYTDRMGTYAGKPGMDVIFNDGTTDKRGNRVGKGFSLNQSHYNLQAREGQTDYDQRSLFDFFLNAPFCEGSPNGSYRTVDGQELSAKELMNREELITRLKNGEVLQFGVKIRLKEDAKDAKVKLEVGLRRAEAQVSAGKIDEETLKEVAAHIGAFGEADDLMREKVYEFAGKKPVDYFKLLESGDRPFRAIIRRSLADGALTKRGQAIYYDSTLIGANEDLAVNAIQTDKTMLESLQEKADLKTSVKVQKPKKA
jgi:hypothetical protein